MTPDTPKTPKTPEAPRLVKAIAASEAHVTKELLDAVRLVRTTGQMTAFEDLVNKKKLLVLADDVWNLVETITVNEDGRMTFGYRQHWRLENDNRLAETVPNVDSFDSTALAIKGPALPPEVDRTPHPEIGEIVESIRGALQPKGFLGTREKGEQVWVRATMADLVPGVKAQGYAMRHHSITPAALARLSIPSPTPTSSSCTIQIVVEGKTKKFWVTWKDGVGTTEIIQDQSDLDAMNVLVQV
jgi:hypothetical protein